MKASHFLLLAFVVVMSATAGQSTEQEQQSEDNGSGSEGESGDGEDIGEGDQQNEGGPSSQIGGLELDNGTVFHEEEVIPATNKCHSNSVCLVSNMSDTKQHILKICDLNGKKPMVCCPREDERTLDKPENPLDSGENSCNTSSGSQGTCVSVSKCTTITKASLSSIQPKLCRWDGITPIICCPLQSPSQKATAIATSVPSPLPAVCSDMPQRPSNSKSGNSNNPVTRRHNYFQAFVVGGIDAKIGQWPFMAALFRKTDIKLNNSFCGGALIGHDVVLTAAHCFLDEPSDMNYVVILGATNLVEGEEGIIPIFREVSKVIAHEDYHYPIAYNDIAIMKLRRPVPFTGAAKPICLPYDAMSRQDFAGQTAYVIGWGSLEFGGPAAKTLQFADVPITTNSDCQNSYKSLRVGASLPNGVPNIMLCAGNRSSKKDACQGDSGGPLVIKDPRGNKAILIGVVAAGYECGRGLPGLYTRVTQYLKWIHKNSR